MPLCGKSLDMVWLAAQGHEVLGVELAPLAVEQFFAENELRPVIHESPYGRHYVAGNIEIICGDIYNLDARILSHCVGAHPRRAGGAAGIHARHMCATSMASCRRPGAGC